MRDFVVAEMINLAIRGGAVARGAPPVRIANMTGGLIETFRHWRTVLRGSLIGFAYEIVREDDGTLLAEGETMHIITNAQMQKRELPEKYRHALQHVR